ncbi:hypothetical protein FBUS_08843, partial [Fasciolopsis buskii]
IPGTPLAVGLNRTAQSETVCPSISQKLSASLSSLMENIPPFGHVASSSCSTVASVTRSGPTVWRNSFDRLLSDPQGIEAFRTHEAANAITIVVPDFFSYFQTFLSSEFSAENLEFWSVVRNWRIHFPGSHIYNLMKADCYPRFLVSSFCRDFSSENVTAGSKLSADRRLPSTLSEIAGRRVSVRSSVVYIESTPPGKLVGQKSLPSPTVPTLRISQVSCSESVVSSQLILPKLHNHTSPVTSTTHRKDVASPG